MNYIFENLLQISIAIFVFVLFGILVFWWLYNNKDKLKEIAVELIKDYIGKVVFLREHKIRFLTLCGDAWKNTSSYSTNELRIKWLEFKIELLKSIFKINEKKERTDSENN